MASSGSFNTSAYSGRYLQFSWSETGQNVANNTTTISWTLKGAGGSSTWYYAQNIKLTIDGTVVYNFPQSQGQIQLGNGTTVATGVYTFTHKDDGTRSFSASAEAGIYQWAVNCTGSGTFTLDTIARASQPSCVTWPEHTQNVGNFGDTISIHMNRNSTSFTHTVRYQFGSKSGTIASNVATGTTWTIPLSLMELIPNATSGSGTIYVDTYNGSTKIGTKYCGFTATVPSTVKPSCTLTLEDVAGIDTTYGSPVQGLSKIKVTVNVTNAYKATTASCQISANGQKYSGTSATTGVLSASGSSAVTATVKDSRGRTGTASYTMSVLAYSAPAVTAISVKRCNEDGTVNKRGKYVKVVFSATVSSMSSKNTAVYKLKYKKTSASSYTTVSLSALANKYSVSNQSHIFAADAGSSYDISVEVADRHKTATRSTKAPTATSILSWRGFKTSSAVEDGLGIGKVPEKANTLQVGWKAEFDKSVALSGNTYAYQPGAFNGEKGYTLLAVVTLNELNVNAPIVFKINRRGAASPMTVYARFASSSTSTDPDLASIKYEGDNYGAFMVKSATSTWKLYVDNTSGWSNPCLQEWYTTDNQMARISVEFPSEQVASLPTPYYRATPLVSQSILDCFYPVGYILLLYSHADPNDMYPGSTWERITNAFLWATTSSGTIGQTGGERNVTLTTAQIPAHSHGSVYSQHADGTKDKTWYTTSGSSVAYGAVSTGGGEAHNNMPPYIQISAWRRTA